jgi:uncharacterized protein (TIGR02246 family)
VCGCRRAGVAVAMSGVVQRRKEIEMKRWGWWLMVLAWSGAAYAGPREDALAAYERFFALFTTDNHDQLVTVFSPDAIFYGTISPERITTPEGIREYFVKALSRSRGEVKANVFETTATVLTDDVVLVTAKWQSERTLDGKMTTNGPSRNTSVMHKRGDRWFIVQFHNSWVPK